MSPSEVSAWWQLFQEIGPYGVSALAFGLVIASASKRAKTPSEQSLPASRADFDALMAKFDHLAGEIMEMKTALAVQSAEAKATEKRLDRMEAKG